MMSGAHILLKPRRYEFGSGGEVGGSREGIQIFYSLIIDCTTVYVWHTHNPKINYRKYLIGKCVH